MVCGGKAISSNTSIHKGNVLADLLQIQLHTNSLEKACKMIQVFGQLTHMAESDEVPSLWLLSGSGLAIAARVNQ